MKHAFLFSSALFVLLGGGCSTTEAQSLKKDPDSYHVVVTLANGEKTDGYVKKGWHAEGSLFKTANYSFKIVESPDAKEAIKYTADQVQSVEYTETTESNPDGIRWESHDVASPGIGNRDRTLRRLVCLDKVGENATLYWWKEWDVTTNARGQTRKLITVYGVRFHDEQKPTVYRYSLVSTVLMDDEHPGLKDFCKNWFKGPEGKARKKESKSDETWMLDMYDAYLASRSQE